MSLGAYRKGTNAEVDRAMELYPLIDEFLKQQKNENSCLEDGYKKLAEILGS